MTLCQKKKMQYQYAPLLGVHKPDPKEFFSQDKSRGSNHLVKNGQNQPKSYRTLLLQRRNCSKCWGSHHIEIAQFHKNNILTVSLISWHHSGCSTVAPKLAQVRVSQRKFKAETSLILWTRSNFSLPCSKLCHPATSRLKSSRMEEKPSQQLKHMRNGSRPGLDTSTSGLPPTRGCPGCYMDLSLFSRSSRLCHIFCKKTKTL